MFSGDYVVYYEKILILLCNIKKLASYDEVKWADNSIMDASTRYNVHTYENLCTSESIVSKMFRTGTLHSTPSLVVKGAHFFLAITILQLTRNCRSIQMPSLYKYKNCKKNCSSYRELFPFKNYSYLCNNLYFI